MIKAKKLFLRFFLGLIAAAALVAGTYFVTVSAMKPAAEQTFPEETVAPEVKNPAVSKESKTEKTVTVSFEDAGGKTYSIEGAVGESYELPDAAQFPGYNFLGWCNEKGEILKGDTVTLEADGKYSPLYIVALDTQNHSPYIFPDDKGFFHVYEQLSRGEAVQMLACLLAVDVEGTGNYMDVAPDAEYALAASKMYQLQIVRGSKLHPDEIISRAELLSMLAAFYPASGEVFSFADVAQTDEIYEVCCTAAALGWIESGEKVQVKPDELLTKLEAVKLINTVLGRGEGLEVTKYMERYAPDIAFDDPDYVHLLEAGMEHAYELSGGKESWTEYESQFIPVHPGAYYTKYGMRLVDDSGVMVRGETVGLVDYDQRGRITSGMPELDKLVEEQMNMLIRDEDDTQLQMLRIMYDYVTHCFSYQKGHIQVDADVSWANDLAYEFLTTGKGNCYAFSAGFAAFAKALGYDAAIQPGCMGEDDALHCWVTINMGGKEYIFDPEFENARLTMHNEVHDMFMMTETFINIWKYQPFTSK